MNLKEIAKLTGYSVSVVSRSLSPNPDKSTTVSPKTREKIRAMAAELGFTRNLAASCIRKQLHPSIVIFQFRASSSSIGDLMNGFTSKAAECDLPLTFQFMENSDNLLEHFRNTTQSYRHLGCIIRHMHVWSSAPSELTELLRQFCISGGKLILMNESLYHPVVKQFNDFPPDCFSTLFYDDYHGGRLAAEYLLEKNCEEFLVFSENLPYSMKRQEGFSDRLAEEGRTCQIFPWKDHQYQVIQKQFNASMKRQLPVGFFLTTDPAALYLQQYAMYHGFRMGQDFHLVGYNAEYSIHRCPFQRFATIAQDYYTQSRMAISMLTEMLDGKSVEPVVFHPELLTEPISGFYQTSEYQI